MNGKIITVTMLSVGLLSALPMHSTENGSETGSTLTELRDASAVRQAQAEYIDQLTGRLMGQNQKQILSNVLKKNESGSTIFGFHNYPTMGWFELGLDGSQQTLWQVQGFDLHAGYYKDGKICGFAETWPNAYREINVETGERISSQNMADNWLAVWECAYDTRRDKIYAYAWKADYSGFVFEEIDPLTFETKVLNDNVDTATQFCPALTFNESEGKLYGINRQGKLSVVSEEDGSLETVVETGVAVTTYMDAMTYSPKDRKYVWVNPSASSQTTLYTIDTATKAVTKICQLPDGDQYYFLLTPDSGVPANAPGELTLVDFGFDGPATTGQIVLTLPDKTADGSPLTGTVTVSGKLDGAPLKEVSGNPGQQVTFRFNKLSEGSHNFAFAPKGGSDNLDGIPFSLTRWIGYDTPVAPQDVKLTVQNLTWDAVTAGVNGGYVNTDDMKYEVWLDGKKISDAATATNIDVNINEDTELKHYVAELQAYYGNHRSEAVESNKLVVGHPLTTPVSMEPTVHDYMLMDILDNNSDGVSWIFDDENKALAYSYNSNTDADDWIFLPVIDFADANHYYELSMDYVNFDKHSPEAFEIAFGREADPATMKTVWSKNYITGNSYETANALLSIDEAGIYRIGIHCTSSRQGWKLLIRNINVVSSTKTKTAPAAITDLTATETEPGSNEALVTFTMPAENGLGQPLTAETKLIGNIITELGKTTCEGAPGDKMSVKVPTANGANTIVANVTADGEESLDATVSITTGVDVPGTPVLVGAEISEDNMSLHLAWKPAETGLNGGYTDPKRLNYNLMQNLPGVGWVEEEFIGADTEYTITVEDGSPQQVIAKGIAALDNVSGIGGTLPVSAVLGTPYSLPMEEDFTDYVANLSPIVMTGDNPQFTIYDAADSDPNAAIDGLPVFTAYTYLPGRSNVGFMLPKFSTEGKASVTFEMNIFGGMYTPSVQFYGSAYGVAPIELGTFEETESGWTKFSCTLPAELLGKKWVSIQAGSKMTNVSRLLIRSYSVSGTNAVNTVDAAGFRVTGGRGMITVETTNPAKLIISTLDGISAAAGMTVAGVNEYHLPAGIYIVKVNNRSYKVVVK